MLLPHRADLRVRPSTIAAMAVVLVLAVMAALPPRALAHEGHDHGAAPAALPATSQPRAATTGDEFEAVAILKNAELLIFVDRFADNSPVTGATVVVTVGSQEIAAKPVPDGTYRLPWPAASKPGRHDVVISIQDGATSDLLIATLDVPSSPPAAGVVTAGPGVRDWVVSQFTASPMLSALVALAIAALIGAALLRRRPWVRAEGGHEIAATAPLAANDRARTAPRKSAAVLALLAAILAGGADLFCQTAYAHEGHDHGGPDTALVVTSDAPRRLPDGGVFLPKPTQRLLEVRTLLVKEAPHQPSQTLVGRVIANPNRSGLVQSSTGGRITPPSTGLPRLGQTVKAGEILAYVTPAFQAIDSSNVSQTAGDLDQQIELARTKLVRAQRLLAANAGTRVQAEEAQLTLNGLEKRRAALSVSQIRSEPLMAPVDGVVSSARAVPGQVVAPQDVLFEIIDARSLWVEALVFDTASTARFEQPVASTQDGASFPLTFVGRSRSLRQQSAILHFEIRAPSAALDVGTPVTVHAQSGTPITAIILPKAAIVRAANGEDVVWRHTEPERFVPTPVKIAPFDGARVLVQAGLSGGQRIVVQSAELISQVR
jgi:membrane fusion protein, heavy metal efflux system